jgi:hypothetical protein
MQDKAKLIGDNIESMTDILASARAVKGRQFHDVALVSFQAMQFIEMAGKIADMPRDQQDEFAEHVLCKIALGLAMVVGDGMSESDFDDAVDLGHTLMGRKVAVEIELERDDD